MVVTVASRACGGRGSVGTRGAGRAGSPCEPEASCGRAALPGFVSSVCFRLRRQGLEKLRRNGGPCVRQNRVVLTVVATVKSLRRCERAQPGRLHHPIRGAREARRNGRLPGDHGISRPTIAQGRPSDRHHLYAAVRFFLRVLFAQRTAGASQNPAFPAPSWMRGARDQAKLGRIAPRGRRGVSVSRAACHKLDLVGWAKRSVPTPCRLWTEIVGTAQVLLCPPYGSAAGMCTGASQ
ncbi:hypothetical protein GGD64_006033 [Bradyrhizobium sp. CIR3A]|nr:hypothetical protein [Bradyrhizobium sp. CIR3A]NYG49288.1 hypothetical protein [Bradyrhizobium sp. IAR9]